MVALATRSPSFRSLLPSKTSIEKYATVVLDLISQGGVAGNGGKGDAQSAGDGTGGEGGRGGEGGTITLTIPSGGNVTLTTTGDSAPAISLQSLADDGGNGGDGESDFAGNGDGGDGGAGGAGGEVKADIQGVSISTNGTKSYPIFARSYGGAGGDGGDGNSVFGGGSGGSGAGSGPGRAVSVTFSGSITSACVSCEDAGGAFLQSVGGFAGDGGSGSGFVSYGADTQSAGGGGRVSLTLLRGSAVETNGATSSAIQLQSVGGGGGKGGSANGIAALGGKGSAGGDGDLVSLTALGGDVTTSGSSSAGLLAQSVGGGGGDSGSSEGLVALGAEAGKGGDGGTVTMNSIATVTTTGDSAVALFGQSVGGGGGSGSTTSATFTYGARGGDGGGGGQVTIANSGDLSTQGFDSPGAYAQSIGGGGGRASRDLAVNVAVSSSFGAAGGAGGSGGAVSYGDASDLSGRSYSITTAGDLSPGVLVESVGGAGGRGSDLITVTQGSLFAVGLGRSGEGGEGGTAGSATISTKANVTTSGNDGAALAANSTGGGGGTSGTLLSVEGLNVYQVGATLGGSGGAGGDGGAVVVQSEGALKTAGDNSSAVEAHSAGGGGGRARFVKTISVLDLIESSAVLGGSGGDGGSGGSVQVEVDAVGGTETATLATLGDNSPGIDAQSVGGGGGSSGKVLNVDSASVFHIGAILGGSGGRGGDGGSVSVVSAGLTTTAGSNSSGVVAQSVGGGGGRSRAVDIYSGVEGIDISSAIGGSAGSGGDGGTVLVETAQGSQVTTVGDNSPGLEAQSVGGGGGSSGRVFDLTGAGAFTLNAAIGGDGGGGGAGGKVTVTNRSDITTAGDHSHGIVARSVSRGGGDSGYVVNGDVLSAFSYNGAFGGSGGGGGRSGDVEVTSTSEIETGGANATGITASSIGGGGGSSGFTFGAGDLALFSVNTAVGGEGGKGGASGAVNVTSTKAITTRGSNSTGILAKSTGGRGGATSTVGAIQGAFKASMNISIGGDSGSGGSAGPVTVDVASGDITTFGEQSAAVSAISTGGDGGKAGMSMALAGTGEYLGTAAVASGGANGGIGGDVTVLVDKDALVTEGQASPAIEAMSLGGSGGSSGLALSGSGTAIYMGSVSVGVDGGVGGTGGQVNVAIEAADLTTREAQSDVIHALSIGGGGGNGSMSVSGSLIASTSMGVALGGDGGDGGQGGAVTVTTSGEGGSELSAFGDSSTAILAQSLGGSGGKAQLTLAGTAISASGQGSVSIGGGGGDGGIGGDVSVVNAADVTVEGDTSAGIHASSQGGSGGKAGMTIAGGSSQWANLAISVGRDGGSGGTGGAVTVENSGAIQIGNPDSSTADFSTAIYALSTGGDGGDAGLTLSGGLLANPQPNQEGSVVGNATVSLGGSGGDGGTGGQVSVTNSGAIKTEGFEGEGITALSVGGDGGTGSQAYTGSLVFTATANTVTAGMSVGGEGGEGAVAGAVTVTNTAEIETTNYKATAISAQSIGGNGGSGGSAYSLYANVDTNVKSQESNFRTTMSVGGKGGTGANAGPVSIGNEAALTTAQGGAHGIFAQSVGGGGGNGGLATSLILPISPPQPPIEEPAQESRQSTVGVDDDGSIFNVSFDTSIGGSGGASGDGASVDLVNSAAITTAGPEAYGLYAQSIGGGGGDGGGASSKTIKVPDPCSWIPSKQIYECKKTDEKKPVNYKLKATVLIGGQGGASGDGGAVTVNNTGDITTSGDTSPAIYARSIGGGGGNGGTSKSGIDAWTTTDTTESFALRESEGDTAKPFLRTLGM